MLRKGPEEPARDGEGGDFGVGEDGNDGDGGDTGGDDDYGDTGKADRACVILFLQSNVAVLFGKIYLQHIIKNPIEFQFLEYFEEVSKRKFLFVTSCPL